MIWGNSVEIGRIDCHGVSDLGCSKQSNSDQYVIANLQQSMIVDDSTLSESSMNPAFGRRQAKLFIVADGIGNEIGERASRLSVETILKFILNRMAVPADLPAASDSRFLAELTELLKSSFFACQTRLRKELEHNPHIQNMGTTLTLVCVVWPRAIVVHAGDSRCYLFRDFRLKQLTTDHTFAQKMVDRGVLEPSRAGRSQWNNVLWNAVGVGSNELDPEVRQLDLKIGDALLLCSDGLTRHVSDRMIAKILSQDRDAQATCRVLVDAANQAGGLDNITAIVSRFRSKERMKTLSGQSLARIGSEQSMKETQIDAATAFAQPSISGNGPPERTQSAQKS